MSLLEKALDIWCADIYHVWQTLKINYDDNSIYGFKTNEGTVGAYQILKSALENLELTRQNMNSYIVQLFCASEPNRLGKASLYQLTKMVSSRRLINIDASDEIISKLSKVLELAVVQEYKQVLDDPIIVSSRIVSAQLLSQKKNPNQPTYSNIDSDDNQLDDFENIDEFYKFLRKDLEKRFSKTSFISSVLDNKFQTRLSSFIKDTQNRYPNTEDLANLTKNEDDFPIENLLKIEPDNLINMIRNRARKILICNHEIKLLRLHIRQRTVPLALLSQNFPYPLLNDNIKFTADYDKLISKVQVEIMELLISYLENDCKQLLENEINEISEALRQVTRQSVDEIAAQLDEIYEAEMKLIIKKFDKSLERESRIKRISFTSLLQKKLKKNNQLSSVSLRVRKDENEIDGLILNNCEISRSSKLKNYKSSKPSTSKPTFRRAKTNAQITTNTAVPTKRSHTTRLTTKSVKQSNDIYTLMPINKQNNNEQESMVGKQTGSKMFLNLKTGKIGKTVKGSETRVTPEEKSYREFISDKSVENMRKSSLVEANLMAPYNELDNASRVVISKMIKNVVKNKLVNPFASQKKTLPQLKNPYPSTETMNEVKVIDHEASETEMEVPAIKSNVVTLNEPFNFSHSTEYKEIVSKVMTLKSFAARSKQYRREKSSENYNSLLFNKDITKSSSNVMKIVIKDKNNKSLKREPSSISYIQEIQPIKIPTVPLSHKSLVPEEKNSPRHSLVPQNTIIQANAESTQLSQDNVSFYSQSKDLSNLQENRRIVRVCVQ